MISDIHPNDIDPETGRPYAGYSSPALDTSFHDHEMDTGDDLADQARADIICKALDAYADQLQRRIEQLRDQVANRRRSGLAPLPSTTRRLVEARADLVAAQRARSDR